MKQILTSVKVPPEFEPLFIKAHEYVSAYFKAKAEDPSKGTIDIFGERYVLVRAASLSVSFFEVVQRLYGKEGAEEAKDIARQLLFDIAHSIGKEDAKRFHEKLRLHDPVEKLSVGPVHFSHSGWAFVDIFPESHPSPDDGYYLIYDHMYSFESSAWLEAGKKSDFPVCIMNAGYSSGWCEESFGLPLVATEIMCKAKGDEACRFIMAPPSRMEGHIAEYMRKKPELAKRITKYEVPSFFKRKEMEETLRESEERFRGAFETSAIGLAIVALNGRWQKVNRSLCNITGYEEAELLAMDFQSITHPNDLAGDLANVTKLVAGDIPYYRMEKRYIHKDGHAVWILLSVSLVHSMDGKPLHFISQIVDISGLKAAQQELKTSEASLNLAQKMANMGSWDHDVATGAMRWSEELYRIAGYQPGEIPPTLDNFFRLVHPEDAAAVRAMAENTLRDLAPFDMEFRLIRKDGAERIIMAHAHPYQAEPGGSKIGGIARDITERKELTKAHENARNNLLESQRLAHLGSWESDLTNGKMFWSDENFRILGYQPDGTKPSYEKFLERIHPDDRERLLASHERSLRERTPFDNEFRIIRNDTGAIRVLHERGIALYNRDGKPRSIVGTTQDITERKQMEQALRESEARFKSVIDNVGIGVSLISPEMEILALNKQMRDWFPNIDTSAKPVCYHAFNMPPRENICDYCPTCKTLADGEIHEAVTETPTGAGTVNYRIVATPIKDDRGKVTAAIEMVEDITARVRAEEDLKRHNEDLNRMMQDLTKAQSLLVRSEKLASIGTLSAGVAHEILNPLNIISTIVQVMQVGAMSPAKTRENLDEILRQIKRATKITDNLRMFAHLHKDENRFINIQDVFEKTATLIEHDLNLENIFIDKDFDPGAPGIYGDEDKIAQIFLNLLTNARDAMKGHRGSIIKVKTAASNHNIVITFSDNGPGIPAEIIGKIFDPFFTTKEPGRGTGLGLSVVHSIVESHNGTIKVESKPGEGTTFTISVPIEARETQRGTT